MNGGTIGVGIIEGGTCVGVGAGPGIGVGVGPGIGVGVRPGVVKGLAEGSTGSGIWEGEVFSWTGPFVPLVASVRTKGLGVLVGVNA